MTISYSIQDLSEIIFGLVVEEKLLPQSVNIKLMEEPYKSGMRYLLEGEKKTREQIITQVGIPAFQTSMEAFEVIKDIKNINWLEMLDKVTADLELAKRLRDAADKLEDGKAFNFSDIVQTFNVIEGKQHKGVLLSDIQAEETPFISSGWPAIDTHLLGFPKKGLITVGANPGQGKTSFLLQANRRFLKKYPEKYSVIFSLEMPAEELKARCMNFNYSEEELKRTIVYDLVFGIDDVCYTAFKHKDNIGFMGVDFADLMLRNEASEGEMGNIYIKLANTAKLLGIPLMLLSQLSRSYQGGVPRPHHLRYTSMAEAVSWMILMLYNPFNDFHAANRENKTLNGEEGEAFIVAWKCRGGFRLHNNQPGAIKILFDGEKGWAPRSNFESWRKVIR